MTAYTSEDLNDDWEFKIVRAGTPVFRKPEVLQQLIEEEAQTGWKLLEKLDDMRVRFKRPRSARAKDAYLSPEIDPYRTQYGRAGRYTATAPVVAIGLGAVMLLLGLAAFAFYLTAR